MREIRNLTVIILLAGALCWGFWAYFWRDHIGENWWIQFSLAFSLFLILGVTLIWGLFFEDRLPDILKNYTGGIYYEQDGLCFMPVVRKRGEQAFVCVYFENRFDSACNAIVHLRPPPETIQHRPDAKDLHFAFSCPPGGVGVIHQPVAVHPKLQGQTIDVRMAAAVDYPQGKGSKVRSHRGLGCGTFDVDWGENFRTGLHELSGEIDLIDPVTIHLPIPRGVTNRIKREQQWRQEIIADMERPTPVAQAF